MGTTIPNQTRVLVVEDQVILGLDLHGTLTDLGYRALPPVTTGEQAIEVAREAKPGLVLMDIVLSGPMDGIAAAAVIQRDMDIPVVFLSADSEALTTQRAKEVQPYGFLLKPHNCRQLQIAIEFALSRHALEREFRAQEEWIETALLCLAEGMVATDQELTIQLLNPAAEALLGVVGGDARGRHLSELLPIEPLVSPESGFEPQALSQSYQDGRWVELPHAGRRCLEIRAEPLRTRAGRECGVLFALHDVTRRRQAEDSRAQLAAALECAGEAVFITDTQGVIRYVNPAFCDLHGYRPEQVVGQTPRLLKTGRQSRDVYSELWGTLLGGEVWRGELWNRNEDGSEVRVRETVAPLRDNYGHITSFVAIEHDLTDLFEAQASLASREEQLRHAQRLEAVGRLAGGVAHDFNNLLTVISGYSSVLLRGKGLTPEVAADLRVINQASDRGAALTRQLLAFSRRQVLRLSQLDLNEVVRRSLTFLKGLIGGHIEVRADLDSGIGLVEADSVQLELVLLNLAANSRDAMPDGGALTLATSRVLPGEDLPDGADPGQPHVLLEVTDTGHGMDEHTLERVFEPFFTTKPADSGTGMGLATVYGIVKQSGGSLRVRSQSGQGCTFQIYLPQVAEAERPRKKSGKTRFPSERGEEVVLLVEDEEWVAKLTTRILEGAGYRVLLARTGLEGLTVCAAEGEAIELVITDVFLPQLSGPNMVSRLRADRPQLPVLYVSGYAEELQTLELGGDLLTCLLEKPYDPDRLLATVREILDAAARRSEPAS